MDLLELRVLLALTLLTATAYSAQTFTTNPCDTNESKELNDPHRSTGFLTAPPEIPICDDNLRRGWYRFTSKAGGEMPTTCQETNRCGTTKPIWLDGSNPTETDGIVMRRICVNMNNSKPQAESCCEHSEDIFVKNCGSFFVYYLYPTVECDMAYCAGNIPPCPVGKWSDTGFPPCQGLFPVLETPPIVTGPDTNVNTSFGFQCHIDYEQNHPDQRFEIDWTFNGVPDPSIADILLSGSEKTAFLDISFLKSHPDTNVACLVRSYYVGRETHKSDSLTSNSTFFGMQIPPVLTGPIVSDNKSFTFQCNIPKDNNNSYQVFEVLWTFDGQPDPSLPPQTVTGFNETAILDGTSLKGHLNTKIGCEVRLAYPESGVNTAYIKSNTYFAGIKITPNPLEMSEIDFEKYVTVTSTIPVICDFNQDCCITFRVNFNETSAVSLMNACEHKMCSSDWNPQLKEASIKIGVVPTRNILVEGLKGVYLSFQVIVPSNSLNYLKVFQDFTPDRLQIIIKDEKAFTCSLTGDPHITGFDFKLVYHLFKGGDFIAYVAQKRNFMIQVRTVPCGGGTVACICGIAVRERNDVIKITNCNSGQTSIDIAYTLSPGTIVQRSTDGYRFGIYLPSGSEVRIESGTINVYVSIPASDKGLGRGMCGTNDGVEDNDFTYPDGKVDPPCTSGSCIPNAFLESWRVSGNESLFEIVPDPINTTDPAYGSSKEYCSCLDKPNGNSTVSCSSRQHVQIANTACSNCQDITDTLIPSYVIGTGWVRPGTNKPEEPFVHPEVKPVDTDKQWPNDQGLTEAQARDICTNAIQKSQLYSKCQNFQQIIDSVITDCLADILFGGTTDFLDDVTSAFTSKCQLKLAQNPDNYVKNPDGDIVMNPELLDHICPIECQKHGQCGEKGLCLCQDGWEGATCLIESGKGPQLVDTKGGIFCDITQDACDAVNFGITNINFMDPLLYSIQAIDEQGNRTGALIIASAVFLSPNTITCRLPALVNAEQSSQRYNISASKNGTIFGNEVTVIVFDGTCLKCDASGCKEKNTSCHINKVCYKNGQDDPKDGNRTCDITKSISRWSKKRSAQDRYPILDTSPNMFGPNFNINGSASFQCQIFYDHEDPEQVFEVVWTFNGQSDPSVPVQLLFGHERSSALSISYLANHVDTNVGCQVRAYYVGYETDKSAFVASNTTYFGIQTPPVLEGPIIPDNKSYIFQCQIIYSSNIFSQEIEVVWTFDGQQDPAIAPLIISGHNQSVDLNGTQLLGHLGTNVCCQVRLVFSDNDVKTRFVSSNSYFVGIQITPDPLQISEIDFEKNVTVTSTIPIICDHDLDCCLTIRLNSNSASAVSLLNSCEHRICSSDWDPYLKSASIQIGVAPKRNILLEGSRSMSLAFEVIPPLGTYLQVFQNYHLSSLQMVVTDKTSFKCSMTGDPHINGFDFKFMYDLYKSGDFIAYVVPERDFMIQIRTVPCGGGSVACICGIVVKERNDVIKLTSCNNPNSGQATIDIAYKLSQGTIIQRSTDGYRFGIFLQSGSEVKVESGGINVYLSIPAFDKGLGRGLCGTNDGVEDNDFTHPDGRVDPACTSRCIPDAFLESWRVNQNESLFEVVPAPVNNTDLVYGLSTQYCSCQDTSDGSSNVSCSTRKYVQTTNTACPGCPVITDNLKPSYVVGTGWVHPGTNKPEEPFVHPEVKPVDTNKQWPNDQGITETQARDICTGAIQKSQLYRQCQNFTQMTDSVISDCLSDILYGGTTAFLDDITSAFTAQCQQILAQNPDNYVTNADGDSIVKPDLLYHICPIECQKHGQCGEKGLCVCHDGWEGETCLIESGKGPQLVEIRSGSVCDFSQVLWCSVNIDITNINFLDKFHCRMQTIDEQGNIEGVAEFIPASFLTPTTITCIVLVPAHSTQRYNISATKDLNLFGNELPFRVFDGTCLDCDLSTCKPKNTACFINNVCYENGEADLNDRNRTCDITKSTSSWTIKSSEQDQFPVLVTPPIVTGPNVHINGSISFQCEVVYDHDDPEQVFEIVWLFNGRSDPSIPSILLFGRERFTTLDITLLRFQVGKYVGCQVRSYYVRYETNKSPYMNSNTTFFGIQTPPLLTGPIMPDNKSFTFQCEVFYNEGNLNQEIEVAWTFDGQQDAVLPPQIISGSNRLIVLDGLHLMGHLGTKIGCQAALFYSGSDVKMAFTQSNTYFIGLKIFPDPLEVSAIDFEKSITVTSTIPLICSHDVDCCLTLKINVNETSAVSLLNSCDHKICSTDRDGYLKTGSVQIGVVPTRNILVEGSKNFNLALELTIPSSSGNYMDLFQNYRPTSLQVTVKDKTAFKCSMTGDPHIFGFDFKQVYDLYNSGDYIAVVVRERDFMIQIRAVPCGAGAVSCICGIVVKEGNNVIKVSKCESALPSVAIAYELSSATVIQRSTDGYRLGVYLPSGSEVRIERGGTNMYISIPAFDKGLGRGLCGTNDGVEDNDFTHLDGRVDPPYSQRLIPDAFLESWRVRGNESLFEVVPDPVNATDPASTSSTQYCSCLERPNGNSTIFCSPRQYIQRTNTACSGCPMITDALKPSYVVGVGWVRPGSSTPDPPFVHPEVKPVDTNKQWPSDQGFTENQARNICVQAIQKSQLFHQCQNQDQLKNSVITDCLADILYGGTTDFLDDITSSFTSQCQLKLAQNPNNYVPNTDGDPVMEPELLDHICPIECQNHGQCGEKGLCFCNDGWEGDTCLIESGRGPQLVEIKGGALCDFSKTACRSINVDVTNINFLDKLRCRVQEVDEQGNSVGAAVMITVVFLSPDTITFTLPVFGQSTHLYNISATTNGTLFGNELQYRVFDGTCLNCDAVGCREKNTACHINNVCYRNGEVDPNDRNRTCDITKSTTKWTARSSENDQFPVLDTSPIVTGPNVDINGSVSFQCEVIYDRYDPEQVFEVIWLFNGLSDPSIPAILLFGRERITTLDITLLRFHVGKYIGCQVRSYYVGYEINKSPYMTSNTTFFGIQTPPLLRGPILLDHKAFTFQCEVFYDQGNSSQEIEVAWTFDGQQDATLPSQIISGSNRLIVLDGLQLIGHLGTKIGCQAALFYSGSVVKMAFTQSNTYFVGLQISPSPLTMSEIDFEKYITVTSTIPIVCEDDLNCCLAFKININETSAVSFVNSCDYKMCSYDWNPLKKTASIQIGVVATRNVLVEGSKDISLAFDVVALQNNGRYLGVFENYQPDKLQVTVKDETSFKCSLTGDPHIMGFDFKFMYDLYKSGDFIAYVAPDRDFMIQVRTVPCGGGTVACICGIVVRERNDIIKVTECSNPFSGQTSIDVAYKLSPGTIVQRSTDGYRFGIYLPSGSEVKIESGGINIYILIPAFDRGLGKGLCGTNDGIEDNDFTHRDGRVDTPCTGRCIPDAFLESWRVRGNESLFEVVPDPVNTTDPSNTVSTPTQYCSCLKKPNGNSTVSCSPRQHVQRTNTACSNCPIITDALIPSYVVGTGWVHPGTNKPEDPFVHPDVKPVDTNKQWPNDQGVTEVQARDICARAMQKSQLFSHCQNFQHLTNSIISDCLADILFGGTTEFLDDITSAFTSQCQLILAQNPDNYDTNADGDLVMKPDLLDHVCPIECQKHGQCGEKGLCLCQDGWKGDTCLIEISKGPQLVDIKGESLCDISQGSCENIHIEVTNIDFSERLQCRVQQVDEQGNNVGAAFITTAVFLSPTVITCTLPATSSAQSMKRYKVSASKDGSLFGNELPYRTFDGTCLECDGTGCKGKSNACHISNTCYKNGDTDINDVNKVCDITKNTSDWTLKNSSPTTDTPEPYYPTRPSKGETMKPCQFCFGG